MKKTIINLTIAALAFWLAHTVHQQSIRTLVNGFHHRQVEQAEHCLQRASAAYDAGVINGLSCGFSDKPWDAYAASKSNYFIVPGLGDSTNVAHHLNEP